MKDKTINQVKDKQGKTIVLNSMEDAQKLYDEHISKMIKQEIPMPVYFYEDEETGEKHYDFEEMANELENRICKKLNRNVLITLSEVDE